MFNPNVSNLNQYGEEAFTNSQDYLDALQIAPLLNKPVWEGGETKIECAHKDCEMIMWHACQICSNNLTLIHERKAAKM